MPTMTTRPPLLKPVPSATLNPWRRPQSVAAQTRQAGYVTASLTKQLFAGLLLLGVLNGCSDGQPKANSSRSMVRTIPVVTTPAERQALKETVTAVGTARAQHSVTLFPESAGLVTGVYFAADQLVDEGDILLELDDRDEQLAVSLAQVNLNDAERQVKRLLSVNRQSGNIAQSQIDTAQAQVDAANIALEKSLVALDRRRVKAPFRGRVGITDIDPGDRVDTGTQVTTLDNRQTLLVDFNVPEAYTQQISEGSAVSASRWQTQSQLYIGQVVAVDSRIDPQSRAFVARAAFNNDSDSLRPGMAFQISVDVSRGNFLAVNNASVQWGADGAYLWIIEQDRATRREVSLVKRQGEKLLIEADIAEGSAIVTEGVQAMREGIAVTVVGDDGQSALANIPIKQDNAGGD